MADSDANGQLQILSGTFRDHLGPTSTHQVVHIRGGSLPMHVLLQDCIWHSNTGRHYFAGSNVTTSIINTSMSSTDTVVSVAVVPGWSLQVGPRPPNHRRQYFG